MILPRTTSKSKHDLNRVDIADHVLWTLAYLTYTALKEEGATGARCIHAARLLMHVPDPSLEFAVTEEKLVISDAIISCHTYVIILNIQCKHIYH